MWSLEHNCDHGLPSTLEWSGWWKCKNNHQFSSLKTVSKAFMWIEIYLFIWSPKFLLSGLLGRYDHTKLANFRSLKLAQLPRPGGQKKKLKKGYTDGNCQATSNWLATSTAV